ncbi:hypothetical protein [Nitriliruptor alkaliphilus]|uniref:hypothetical protein n=1 Tax=Nitriliruptor alkaliphilus TaxID=427918 RepID=UPI0006989651|nr:hypothetical protein [Nitriliruptor alkaliphilus]
MVRRLPHVIALAAIILLCLPTAAFADYTARVEAPGNGVVTGSTEVQVRVVREWVDPPVTGLRVRSVTGGEWHTTTCKAGCESGDHLSIYAFDLDPRTGAPFGSSIMRNGTFEFEGAIERAIGGDRSIGKLTLSLRVPGSAVGGLAATVSDEKVRLAWSRAPEPDILRYRVERCAGTCDGAGAWVAVGEAAASASSFSDEPGVGKHSYRVVTVRDVDGEGSIETVSSPVTTEVEAPPVDPAERQPGDGNSGGNGDGSGGDGNGAGNGGGSTDGSGSPRSGSAPDLDEVDAPDDRATPEASPSSRTSRSSGVRSGRAPSVSLGRGGSGIPELPGIGDIFRGELDYSADEPRTADGSGDSGPGADDEVLLSSPDVSGNTFIGQMTDPDRIAVPIAGGLLMTAIGLHLWRWLRVPLD